MRTFVVGCAGVVLLAGCAGGAGHQGESRHGSPDSPAPSSSSSSSVAVNPIRSPAQLLRDAVVEAERPEPGQVKGTVTFRGLTLLKVYAQDDPGGGEPSRELIIARRDRGAPYVARTVVAEGEIYLRRRGLPTQPGRPWLHLPGRRYPAGLDDWEALRDLTQPETHLEALAAHGTGLRRRTAQLVTQVILVTGRLAAPYLPKGICEGDGSARLRPDSVRFSVWINSGDEIDKLRLECRYADMPTVTWSSRYEYLDGLTMLPPPPRKVSEPDTVAPVSPDEVSASPQSA